jgi:hypothetical protein
MSRKTWLVGDGPQSFLDPLDKRSQRHHLLLFGEDSKFDQPSVRNQRRFGDLHARFLSPENKQRNSYMRSDEWTVVRDEMTGFKHTKQQFKNTHDAMTDNIVKKETTLAAARGKITKMSGKVGSSHWPIDGQASGSWDMRVYDADGWENYRVGDGRVAPWDRSATRPVINPEPRQRPATAGELTPPRTPPRRSSNGTSEHSIIQHLTPEAQERFRHHVNDLQAQKSAARAAQ